MNATAKVPASHQIRIDPQIEHVWDDIAKDESLVFSLYLYRKLRWRSLRGQATEGDREALNRIEPRIRDHVEGDSIRYRRFKCSLEGSLIVQSHGLRIIHTISLVDMSATGARVRYVDHVEPEALAYLAIPQRILGEAVLEWPARIIWAQGGHVGMQFSSGD